MTTIQDFIGARRTEIKAQITALRSELQQLDVAASAIASTSSASTSNTKPLTKKAVGRSAQAAIDNMTIKDMAMEVMKQLAPEVRVSTTALNDAIKDRFSHTIARSSLSPQLSRLKSEGKIDMVNGLWFLNPSPLPETSSSENENRLLDGEESA